MRTSPSGASTRTFDVGDAAVYAPITVVMTGLAATTTVTASTTTGDHPNLAATGLDPSKSVNRYWTLTPTGSPSFTSYDATFNFAAGDVDGGASTSSFVVSRFSSGAWNATTAGTRTATSTQALGVTSFSDFAIAEVSAGIFALTVPIVGSGTVVRNPSQLYYPASSLVQLTATAGTGYTFTGWSGDATGTPTRSTSPWTPTRPSPRPSRSIATR